MAQRNWGNPPITSTQGPISTGASTSILMAEISSLAYGLYQGHVTVGGTTVASFRIEQTLSTGLGSTALRDNGARGELGQLVVYTPADQSAEYLVSLAAQAGDIVRVRMSSAIASGEEVAARIILEILT